MSTSAFTSEKSSLGEAALPLSTDVAEVNVMLCYDCVPFTQMIAVKKVIPNGSERHIVFCKHGKVCARNALGF